MQKKCQSSKKPKTMFSLNHAIELVSILCAVKAQQPPPINAGDGGIGHWNPQTGVRPGSPPGWTPNVATPTDGQNSPSQSPAFAWTPSGSVAPRPGPNGGFSSADQARPNFRAYHDIAFPSIKYLHQPSYDYANALAKSMLFYEAQRSGGLPYDHRIPWRSDSALDDGQDNNVDLSGGYYDGGGYVKYGFPMAYTITVLSWGIIRYRRTYEAIGQLEHALKTIKWGTDYFLKCKTGPTEFFGQVSDQQSDSRYIGIPEKMDYTRRSYVLNENRPGTELIAETAAAMAAASVVFYETDRAYSDVLIANAKELYHFANDYKGSYHNSIKMAEAAYRSHSGFKDELAWAAAWIYRRTGDNKFLRDAKRIYKSAKLNSQAILFSWDDKKVGVQMLLAEMTKREIYKSQVQQFCNHNLPKGKSTYTKRGLLFAAEWGALRYAANAAFICALAAEMGINSDQYRLFALNQTNYILGSTGRSYVVGFGENPPTKYYHRASYCPSPPEPCPAFSANFDNAHTLYGALIGGPSNADIFYNAIEKREQSSVAIDYNAGYQSALAAVLDIHIFGMSDRPKLIKPGMISAENDTKEEELKEDGQTDTAKIIYDYGKALDYSILFYEAQRSGKLSADSRIPWRGDSAMNDGNAINESLSGGYYDGGDYVKYTFPLAFTITTLSWGAIEYMDAYNTSGKLFSALSGIQWGADYLIKCHLYNRGAIVSQVGDTYYESTSWDRPEYINHTAPRPVKTITATNPGADVIAEMAAAFASVSLALTDILTEDYRYNVLIQKAKDLFEIAENIPGIYTKLDVSAINIYNSTGYHDELAWAAIWIYKATKDTKYLNSAKTYAIKLLNTPKTFSYDDKTAAVHLLLAEETHDWTELVKFCDWVLNEARKTPKGLLYEAVPATKHAGNVAFIMLLASQKFRAHPNAEAWKWFARDQINYILGSTGQSYQVGYGTKYPQQPYHKSSSCPRKPKPCGFSYRDSGTPNQQLLNGAVVAGPDLNDDFEDNRIKRQYTDVSLDTNAGFQSALAGLIHLQKRGLLNGASTTSLFINRLPLPIATALLLQLAVYLLINYVSTK